MATGGASLSEAPPQQARLRGAAGSAGRCRGLRAGGGAARTGGGGGGSRVGLRRGRGGSGPAISPVSPACEGDRRRWPAVAAKFLLR